jgi:hypothetical protein
MGPFKEMWGIGYMLGAGKQERRGPSLPLRQKKANNKQQTRLALISNWSRAMYQRAILVQP